MKRDAVTLVTKDTTGWTSDNETGGWYMAAGPVTVGRVTVSGDVNLILANGASLTVDGGINVSGAHLTIWGQNADYTRDGALTAIGYDDNAGIGAGYRRYDANVTINGGVITATGTDGAAGIGSGYSSSSATVTINGGVVKGAGHNSAGIGSGYAGSTATVIINGGTVTGVAGAYSADIGAGGYGSSADVTITGGSVKGSLNVQPHDANGDPVYKLELSNPRGLAVTIGGKAWQPKNHAAFGDTTLYAYVSRALEDSGLLHVTMNGKETLYAFGSSGLTEVTGFDKSRATWTWTDEPVSATLTLPLRGGGDPVVLGGRVTVAGETPATCTEKGSRTYAAMATIGGETFTAEKTVELKALGHAWSGAVAWSEDHAQATVTFTCGNDKSHTETVTVDAASAVTKPATCAEPGALVYTADASAKAAELGCETGTFTVTEPIAALGHDWDVEGDEIGLIPGSEGDYTTLTITCRNDHSHTQTVYTKAEKISETPATCTAEGSATYRMSYEFEGVKHVVENEDTYTLAKLPHTWSDWTTVSSTASGAVLERECAVCHEKEQSDHRHTYVFPDDAQWTVVNDRVVSAAVKVACKDCDWNATLTYSGDKIASRLVTAATCTTDGVTAWTVDVDLDGQTKSYTKQTVVPAEGHLWTVDEADMVWSADHSAATFTFQCMTCGETTAVRAASTVLGVTAPTCEQSGTTVYSAAAEYGGAAVSVTESVQTPALGHDWDVEGDQYPLRGSVKGDFTTVTVFCKHDPAHSQTVYTGLRKVKDEPATCTGSGVVGYQMEFALGGQSYLCGEEDDYEFPALGHRYTAGHVCAVCGAQEPVTVGVEYTWELPAADDTSRVQWSQLAIGAAPYVTVTATRTGSDGSSTTQQIVVTDLTVAHTAKCEETGATTYTAVVEIGGVSATYTKEYADVPPAGHQWNAEPAVTWSDDMRTATFTVTCARDASHTESVTVPVAAATVTAATCESAGAVRYTATAQMQDGKTVMAEQTKETAPLGHAWCFSADDANPPKLERVDGVLTATLTCRNDPSHIWTTTDLQEKLIGHVQTATGAADGKDLYRISVTVDGKTYVLGDETRTVSAAPVVTVANVADGIKLSWTKVNTADTYRVYYRVHGGSWHAIGHTTKRTYTWKHGKDGTKYEFTVRGCTVSGTKKTLLPGGYNTSKTIQYVIAPKVTVKAVKGGIQVSWTKVAGADTYRVYYKQPGGKWHAIGHNKNLTYTWKHGTAGKTYQFTVRPCTVSGTKKTLLGAGYNTSKSVKFTK